MFDFTDQLTNAIIDTSADTSCDKVFTEMTTGEVEIDLTMVTHPHADDIIVPFTKDGERFELAFEGARADAYYQTTAADMVAMEGAGFEPKMTLKVTGTWVEREWTKRSGKVAKTMRLMVAQWSWNDKTAGHLPA